MARIVDGQAVAAAHGIAPVRARLQTLKVPEVPAVLYCAVGFGVECHHPLAVVVYVQSLFVAAQLDAVRAIDAVSNLDGLSARWNVVDGRRQRRRSRGRRLKRKVRKVNAA